MAIAKYWNGSSWVTFIMKHYNGSGWDDVPKYYDGTQWVDLGAVETITLSGGSGQLFNNMTSDFAIAGTASAAWQFRSDGTVYKQGFTTTQFQSGTEWSDFQPTPGQTYYIRATNDWGSNPSTGPSLNTWHALSVNRIWAWNKTGLGTYQGGLKIEIATDSGGTNIVATGYYGGQATIEP